ncbi:class F sortase [Streptomyces sp. CC228A]|uniref:class F sortase n=1 Tax=Streptomyces sp. CC228A TaxID=2898186 RepID=UPI001F3106A9|nr:class F sortase [Streptomyces sp. CC228A]
MPAVRLAGWGLRLGRSRTARALYRAARRPAARLARWARGRRRARGGRRPGAGTGPAAAVRAGPVGRVRSAGRGRPRAAGRLGRAARRGGGVLRREPGPARLLAWAGLAAAASAALTLALPAGAPSPADTGALPSAPAGPARPAGSAHAPPVALSVPGHVGTLPVDPVAASRDGALDVPASPSRVGWWALGARPGDPRGTLLLAGHIDSAEEGAGPFEALHALPMGARAHVAAADGTRHTYRIVARRTYRAGDLPQDLFSAAGRPRLALVTCAGDFDPQAGAYAENLVLYGVPG